jgi:Phage derived protein Gp49-like (DUF891)
MQFVDSRGREVKNRLFAIIKKTADEGAYTSEEIYRHVGNGIYEFKAQTARVYCFMAGNRIVLTHGAVKPKSVVKDRSRAEQVREEYEDWKGQDQ